MKPQKNDQGIYTLILCLPQAVRISVGSLGRMDFAQGYYSYTGSARGPGGLKRVDRHKLVSQGTKLTRRWHIDYLLPHCQILETIITRTELDLECIIARAIEEKLSPLPRFGCSDCRCISHLHHSRSLAEMKKSVALAHAIAQVQGSVKSDFPKREREISGRI
jgi:endonuclease-3